MTLDAPPRTDQAVTCSNCEACCCRLEVMLISETGVPEKFTEQDAWGSWHMKRGEDGWCAALDRSTYKCTIYEQRPWVCREFEAGDYACLIERAAFL